MMKISDNKHNTSKNANCCHTVVLMEKPILRLFRHTNIHSPLASLLGLPQYQTIKYYKEDK